MRQTEHLSQRQFPPKGDEEAKAELLRQLKGNFRKRDLKWLKDPSITVDAAERIDASDIDWSTYPEWRASRQLKAVRKVADKIDDGKDKPVVTYQSPGGRRKLMDGHHHALGYVDHKENPLGYTIHVPHDNGPWATLHDRQVDDTKKDDFGKTSKADRND